METTNHIVMLRDTHTLKCVHCGMTYEMAMPCPAKIFVAICDAFIGSHKDCEAPDDKAYQPEGLNMPIDRGAWDDVPDASKWVDDLRGNE